MKKYLYWAIIIAIISVVVIMFWQQMRIRRLTDECSRYRTNTTTLLENVETYKTRDGLNAAKVGELEIRLSQYEKYRAEDAALISTLQTKNRDLAAVAKAQTETINQLRGELRDTVVVQTVPGDTVWIEVPAKKIDITEPYIELHGYATDNEFVGAVTTRDTLLITETVKYKRFLGFLWKTNKIKNREFDIVSRNPYTQINDFEVITIEK